MALLTAKQIANEALVQLMINLAASSVFYRGLEPEIAGTPRNGGTISIRRPAVFEAQEFTTDIVEQEADEGEVEMTIEHLFDITVPITAKQLTFSLTDFSSQIVSGAMIAIAEKFERYILSKGVQIWNTIGTVGTAVDSLPKLMQNVAYLSHWKVPGANRIGIVSPFQAADLKGTETLVRADARADQGVALREAMLGRTAGLNWFESQATFKHVAGTISNGTGKLAKVNGTPAVGALVMNIDETTLTGTVVAGDVFTIAGVVDDEGKPYWHRVTAGATAASNAIAGLAFEPALKVAPADNAVITFVGTHKIGIVGHPNGLAWACIPPALPMGNERAAVASYNGFGVRVVIGYDQRKKKDLISFDTFAAAKVIQPELLSRWIS
jgi:hypothetical protein